MPISPKLELELNGVGGGWTDKTRDLMGEESGDFGLPGNGPLDLVGDPGTLRFGLNNHESNSVGLRGAYSPDHANCLAGFGEGITRVRYSLVVGAHTYVMHIGTIDEIVPPSLPYDSDFVTRCTSVDYMDDLMRAPVSGVGILENVRDDEIFSALVAVVPRQPDAIDVSNGPDTFEVALDKVDAQTKIRPVLQDVCQSSLSKVYVQGGTLTYEPRSVRASATTPLDTFDSKLYRFEPNRSRANRYTRVEVTAHPRSADASPTTVLWTLPTGASGAIAVGPYSTVEIWVQYTDPANRTSPIGGLDVVTTPLVPGTDYTFNSAADGSGSDLTAFLTMTITPFISWAKLRFENAGGASGFVIAPTQVVGRGIYDYAPALTVAEDASLQSTVVLNSLSFDAPYQGDIAKAAEFGQYLMNLYKKKATRIRVSFHCPRSDTALADRLLARGISDLVAFGEALSGIATSASYFINRVTWRADNRSNLEITWDLAPADQTGYWLLEVVGRSELDSTTILGFGLIAA